MKMGFKNDDTTDVELEGFDVTVDQLLTILQNVKDKGGGDAIVTLLADGPYYLNILETWYEEFTIPKAEGDQKAKYLSIGVGINEVIK